MDIKCPYCEKVFTVTKYAKWNYGVSSKYYEEWEDTLEIRCDCGKLIGVLKNREVKPCDLKKGDIEFVSSDEVARNAAFTLASELCKKVSSVGMTYREIRMELCRQAMLMFFDYEIENMGRSNGEDSKKKAKHKRVWHKNRGTRDKGGE